MQSTIIRLINTKIIITWLFIVLIIFSTFLASILKEIPNQHFLTIPCFCIDPTRQVCQFLIAEDNRKQGN
jgi:hypothetical protein